jgi:hypothetical protein
MASPSYEDVLRADYKSGRSVLPDKIYVALRDPGIINLRDQSTKSSSKVSETNSIAYNEKENVYHVKFVGLDIYKPGSWENVYFFAKYFSLICSCVNRSAVLSYKHLNVAFHFNGPKFPPIEQTNIERIISLEVNEDAWIVKAWTFNRHNPSLVDGPMNASTISFSYKASPQSVSIANMTLTKCKEVHPQNFEIGGSYANLDISDHLGTICNIIWNLTTRKLISTEIATDLIKDPTQWKNYNAKELVLGISSQSFPEDVQVPKANLPIPTKTFDTVLDLVKMTSQQLSISSAVNIGRGNSIDTYVSKSTESSETMDISSPIELKSGLSVLDMFDSLESKSKIDTNLISLESSSSWIEWN